MRVSLSAMYLVHPTSKVTLAIIDSQNVLTNQSSQQIDGNGHRKLTATLQIMAKVISLMRDVLLRACGRVFRHTTPNLTFKCGKSVVFIV